MGRVVPSAMVRVACAIALFVATALAGCTEDDKAAVTTDLITPGTWDVRGDTDHILAWARNDADGTHSIAWSLTGVDGPLPEGWSATFNPAESTLSPVGTKVAGPRGYTYPDWARTLITLTVPASQASGEVDLVLHAGDATQPVKVVVHDGRGQVSGPGSRVEVQYEGRFHDTGVAFDDGSFETTLGRGDTVPGFDFGLMGLAPGETATIVIPPPFGYGYDPPASHARFAGKTLEFRVTITSLEG